MKPIYAIGVLALFVAMVGTLGYVLQTPTVSSDEIVSQNGLHWHARLTVRVNGEVMNIPANIGLGTVHNPIHTHDDEPGLIHLEFGGKVMQSDLMLGKFFDVWKKDLGTAASMTVNGVENSEFEQYHMKDGDVIEISYP
jgi:hypothetical protein